MTVPDVLTRPFIACAVVAIVAVLLLARKRTRSTGQSSSISWSVPVEMFVPEPRHWPLAAIAVAINPLRPWDTIAAINRGEAVQELATTWRIRDRGALRARLLDLLYHGDRAVYEPMIAKLSTLPFREAVEVAKHIKNDTSGPLEEREGHVWRTRIALTSADAITTVAFLAFDLVRFIDLCALGIAAGYVEESRGVGLMLVAAERLRQRYKSFEDIADHFVRGRAFWAANAKDQQAQQKRIAAHQHVLASSTNTPWRYVSWSMSFPPGDDAVATLHNGGHT